jgi:GMP synthase PP-ATPase subunit
VTRERLDLLREADEAVMNGLRRHGICDAIWQCPTVLVPLRIERASVSTLYGELVLAGVPA